MKTTHPAVSSNVSNKAKQSPLTRRRDGLIIFVFSLLAVFFSIAFLYWTVVPFFQMKTYLAYLHAGKTRKIAATEFIFSPYSYAQRVIRYEYLKYLEGRDIPVQDVPFLDHAIGKMEEMVALEGSDPYQHIRLARAYEKKVALLNDRSYFKQAEDAYKKALSLAPQRQEAYYAYGLSLMRQSRFEEAIALLKAPPALDPTIPLSYYYLGMAQFNQGEVSYADALTNMESFFERSETDPDLNISRAIYQRLFHYFYQKQDVAHFRTAASRLPRLDSDRQALYQQAIVSMQQTDQIPRLDFKDNLIQAFAP